MLEVKALRNVLSYKKLKNEELVMCLSVWTLSVLIKSDIDAAAPLDIIGNKLGNQIAGMCASMNHLPERSCCHI